MGPMQRGSFVAEDTYIARHRSVIRERDRLEAALAEAQERGDTDAVTRLRARLDELTAWPDRAIRHEHPW
jgi:hypothetical protein